jgi:hypothetical protein
MLFSERVCILFLLRNSAVSAVYNHIASATFAMVPSLFVLEHFRERVTIMALLAINL